MTLGVDMPRSKSIRQAVSTWKEQQSKLKSDKDSLQASIQRAKDLIAQIDSQMADLKASVDLMDQLAPDDGPPPVEDHTILPGTS